MKTRVFSFFQFPKEVIDFEILLEFSNRQNFGTICSSMLHPIMLDKKITKTITIICKQKKKRFLQIWNWLLLKKSVARWINIFYYTDRIRQTFINSKFSQTVTDKTRKNLCYKFPKDQPTNSDATLTEKKKSIFLYLQWGKEILYAIKFFINIFF